MKSKARRFEVGRPLSANELMLPFWDQKREQRRQRPFIPAQMSCLYHKAFSQVGYWHNKKRQKVEERPLKMGSLVLLQVEHLDVEDEGRVGGDARHTL